jgi:hypothetical protein
MSNRGISASGRQAQRKFIEPAESKHSLRAPPPGKQPQVPVSPKMGKMSIGDAIGLITIRLSKLETFMLSMEGHTSNISDSTTLMLSLSSRVNALEHASSMVDREEGSEAEDYIPKQEDPNSWELQRDVFISEMKTLQSEVDDLRKLVIKLQTSL